MTTAAHPGYVYSPLIAIHAHAHFHGRPHKSHCYTINIVVDICDHIPFTFILLPNYRSSGVKLLSFLYLHLKCMHYSGYLPL